MERKVYVTAQFDSVDQRGLGNVDVRSKGGVEGENSTFWSNNGIYQVFMHVIIRGLRKSCLLMVDASYKCGTEDSLSCGIAIMLKFNI